MPPVGQWAAIPNSVITASGVGWSGASPGGTANYRGVIDAYSGGVLTDGFYLDGVWLPGPTLMFWGGGHTDYGGNEWYAFRVRQGTWHRVTDPSLPSGINTPYAPDGKPTARHTYAALNYVDDGQQKIIHSFGLFGRYQDAGASHNTTDIFDLTVPNPRSGNPWSRGVDSPFASWYTAYDRARGRIWAVPYVGNAIGYYDTATRTYVSAGFKSPNFNSQGGVDFDANRDMLVGATSFGLCAYRTNNGVASNYISLASTGTPPPTYKSLIWDSSLDAFVSWCGGANLYKLTPPPSNPYQGGDPWAWSTITPTAGDTPPAVANGAGIWGAHFCKVSFGTERGYALLNTSSDPVFFYRAA